MSDQAICSIGVGERTSRPFTEAEEEANGQEEHAVSAMLIYNGSAFELAQMLRAASQRNPTPIAAEIVETVPGTAEGSTTLAASFSGEKRSAAPEKAAA
jgi:hypothetical protein